MSFGSDTSSFAPWAVDHASADVIFVISATASKYPTNVAVAGPDCSAIVSQNRWDVDTWSFAGQVPLRFSSLMEGVEMFDNNAFSMSQQEVRHMDPQARLLLQQTAEVFTFSGHLRLKSLEIGVVVGTYQDEYGPTAAKALSMTSYDVTNMVTCPQAGRISYFFGLKGSCCTVDTACSSALVSANLAVSSLQSTNSPAHVVASVNLVMPIMQAACTVANMLSADGRSKTLDAAADGYGRAEACFVHLFESQLIGDGTDKAMAIVMASHVNQDGRSSSLTAPHGPSQERLVVDAMIKARVGPNDVGYYELHGTGKCCHSHMLTTH